MRFRNFQKTIAVIQFRNGSDRLFTPLFTRDCPAFMPHFPSLTSGHCSAISPPNLLSTEKTMAIRK
ncbi:hypothetical protein [Phascolarctobacterium faecium]|uniref:hypothetical protein n=1 Tax=Phascolarctobacterium faecium TaxID=33025 RepID=UPI00307E1E5A